MTLKVDKLITLWRPKGGQTNNSPAYAYIYIYIYAGHIAFRPVCCLLLLAETTFVVFLEGKEEDLFLTLNWCLSGRRF